MKRRRRTTAARTLRGTLRGTKMAKIDLVPYEFKGTLGAAVTECMPLKPNQRVQVCIRRPDKPGPQIANPPDVCRFLRGAAGADRESIYAVLLDTGNHVIGIEEVAKGNLDTVTSLPREIFKSAVATNAKAIILAHNHPSGNPTPSRPDIEFTVKLLQASDIVGIPLLDHIVVGERDCVSIMETIANRIRNSGGGPLFGPQLRRALSRSRRRGWKR